ncbi:MAG: PIN domain-containing protein [Spirochaetaceae bacterium]|nr:MAG: PIN domain-containing protein [Spirochaetaceae bacterium]
MSKIFIDTNLLVYSIDQKELEKKNQARHILRRIIDVHQPVISTQVIKEFYVAATTKLRAEHLIVKNIIHNFRNMEVVNSDLELIERAIDISVVSQLSFWDSLIIAAAEKANCEFVFSEGLNAGQTYRGVVVTDPFVKDDFQKSLQPASGNRPLRRLNVCL